MNVLFRENAYEPIMAALNSASGNPANNCQHQPHCSDSREHEFRVACENVRPALVKAEIDWLWNYLRHCTETGEGGWGRGHAGDPEWLPEAMAASVGW